MKITLKELRDLILEALNETPLEDVHPFSDIDGIHGGHEGLPLQGRLKTWPRFDKDKKQVQKYFEKSDLKNRAVKTYKNLSVPIHIIPVFDRTHVSYQTTRIKNVLPIYWHDVLTKEVNISDEKTEKLIKELEAGATVWLVAAGKLVKNFLPTPWMIVHAMVDADDAFFDELSEEIYHLIYSHNNASTRVDRSLIVDLWSQLTMGSARSGFFKERPSLQDLIAEIITQEILTTSGFVFNESEDQQINDLLLTIQGMVAGARDKFESSVSGQMFFVSVYAQDFKI